MNEWPVVQLGELVESHDARRVPVREADRKPGPYPYFGASGIVDHVDGFLFDGEFLLVAEDGENLRTRQTPIAFMASGRFWVNNHAHVVRGNARAITRFLHYALQIADVSAYLTGSTMPKLTQGNLNRIPVPAPPLDEQRAIARVLGALDDKIELNRRMNETLEAMARALFKSWFVDFDPVRAKQRGEAPAGMDAATAALFPSRLVATEHGELPEGWRHAPLSEWVEVLSGGTPSKANPALWNGSLKWISPKAMLRIHADECEDCVSRDAVGNGTRLAPMGATLVMVRGMGLHEGFRVSQVREDVTFNQDVKALVPRRVHPDLLLFAMLDGQQALHQRVESSGHGTGKMPTEILVSYPLTLPTPSTQEVLGSRFTALNDRIAANTAESRTLAVLRDTLLPKLLSGELRVPEAERAVAEVA